MIQDSFKNPNWLVTCDVETRYPIQNDEMKLVAYIAVNTETKDIVVVFRQTANLLNVMTDLFTLPQQHMANDVTAHVHSGFMDALQAIQADIERIITREFQDPAKQDYRLTFTGFSMGAALATLSAYMMLSTDLVHHRRFRLVSFGSPRVGDDVFASTLEHAPIDIYRVMKEFDPIGRVPFRKSGYRHAGNEVWIHNGEFYYCHHTDLVRKCSKQRSRPIRANEYHDYAILNQYV